MNFPPIQPITTSTPWDAIPGALQQGVQGYQEGKQLQAMLMQKMLERQLKQAQFDKDTATTNYINSKLPTSATGEPMPDQAPNPAPVSKPPFAVPGQGGTTPQDQGMPTPPEPPPARKPLFKTPGMPPPGVSPADWSKSLAQQGRDKTKQQLTNNGIPRGLATILKTSGFSTQESNKIDAMASAIPIHNEITDAIIAYGKNDPSVAQATVNKYIAGHPTLSGFFQDYKANPNNQAAMYDALTRLGAIEQYKLSNGSQAAPTEEAVIKNQALYPTLQEIAAKSPNVAMKMNDMLENTITPAITGPITRMGYMKNEETGKMPAAVLDTIYNNLTKGRDTLGQKIKSLPGYKSNPKGIMQIPPAQSGLDQQAPGGQIDWSKYHK